MKRLIPLTLALALVAGLQTNAVAAGDPLLSKQWALTNFPTTKLQPSGRGVWGYE